MAITVDLTTPAELVTGQYGRISIAVNNDTADDVVVEGIVINDKYNVFTTGKFSSGLPIFDTVYVGGTPVVPHVVDPSQPSSEVGWVLYPGNISGSVPTLSSPSGSYANGPLSGNLLLGGSDGASRVIPSGSTYTYYTDIVSFKPSPAIINFPIYGTIAPAGTLQASVLVSGSTEPILSNEEDISLFAGNATGIKCNFAGNPAQTFPVTADAPLVPPPSTSIYGVTNLVIPYARPAAFADFDFVVQTKVVLDNLTEIDITTNTGVTHAYSSSNTDFMTVVENGPYGATTSSYAGGYSQLSGGAGAVTIVATYAPSDTEFYNISNVVNGFSSSVDFTNNSYLPVAFFSSPALIQTRYGEPAVPFQALYQYYGFEGDLEDDTTSCTFEVYPAGLISVDGSGNVTQIADIDGTATITSTVDFGEDYPALNGAKCVTKVVCRASNTKN